MGWLAVFLFPMIVVGLSSIELGLGRASWFFCMWSLSLQLVYLTWQMGTKMGFSREKAAWLKCLSVSWPKQVIWLSPELTWERFYTKEWILQVVTPGSTTSGERGFSWKDMVSWQLGPLKLWMWEAECFRAVVLNLGCTVKLLGELGKF